MANETVEVPVSLLNDIYAALNNGDGYTSLMYSRYSRHLPTDLVDDLKNYTRDVRRVISDVQEFI